MKTINAFNDQHQPKRICYLLIENQQNHLIPIDQLKYSLCTHWIFSFAHLDDYNVNVSTLMDDYIRKVMSSTNNQTEQYYLISIGTTDMSFVDNPKKIEKFIDSIIQLMDRFYLDGFDLDWEFPMQRKHQFTHLLRMIRYRFKHKFNHRGKPYILSVALSPVIYIVETSYDIHSIGHLVDFVNLMTYDFHSPNTIPYTNFNSPLYANQLDRLYFEYFNTNFAVNYMIQLGLLPQKIMVGIPFYGYKYYLVNKNFHNLYALSNGTEVPVAFNEICDDFLLDPNTTIVFDHYSKVPYAYREYEWITYDDYESITIKAQWIMDNHLGGSMTFPLNYDDYNGEKCINNKQQQQRQRRRSKHYPLQSILFDIIN
nr:acidic mammalian chitinase-like [Dermatophagoides farinae]